MATLRLKRLQIDRFRNVAPGTVLEFNDGMNVLLGPNGSGKTTLLRLIAAIVRDEFEFLADEPLDITYNIEFLSTTFRVHLSNRRDNGHARRVAGGAVVTPDWHFDISVAQREWQEKLLTGTPLGVSLLPGGPHALPVQDPLRESGPMAQAVSALAELAQLAQGLAEKNPLVHTSKMFETISAFCDHVGQLAELRHTLWSQGGRFDEGLGVFAGIVGSAAVLDMPDYRLVHLMREEGEVSGAFVPDELRHAVRSLPKEDGGKDITLGHENLPFLQRVGELLNARQARITLRLREKSEDGAEHFSNFEFLFTLDDGTVIRHDLLSWGQKRLLSFFYYAAANPDILVVDELVNGLHHEWISACLKEMEGRQCFLTSQNPLLLDQLVFQSAEDVRRTFIQCRREKGERRAELHWHPMDEASAESFFRAYRVGIQHVGEILRTKGLW